MDSSLPESRERKEKKVDAIDCREEIVNKILLWAAAKGIDIEERCGDHKAVYRDCTGTS